MRCTCRGLGGHEKVVFQDPLLEEKILTPYVCVPAHVAAIHCRYIASKNTPSSDSIGLRLRATKRCKDCTSSSRTLGANTDHATESELNQKTRSLARHTWRKKNVNIAAWAILFALVIVGSVFIGTHGFGFVHGEPRVLFHHHLVFC